VFQESVAGNWGISGAVVIGFVVVVTGLVVVVTGFVVVVTGLVVVVTGFVVVTGLVVVVTGLAVVTCLVVVVIGLAVVAGNSVVVSIGIAGVVPGITAVVSGLIGGVVTGIVEVISGSGIDSGGIGSKVVVVTVGESDDWAGVLLSSVLPSVQAVRVSATKRDESKTVFFMEDSFHEESIGISYHEFTEMSIDSRLA
jgi:hypothetical protein